jgi:hypothetical protein
MKAAPVNDRSGASLIFGSEENRGAEKPLEAVDEAVVVRAVFGKMEEVEHLGGSAEMNLAGLLPESKRSHPDRDEPILAEPQAKIWMGYDMKEESAIAPAMSGLAGRRTAEREPSQDERAGVEGEFLPSAHALLADETD